jgi:hypothetical protein
MWRENTRRSRVIRECALAPALFGGAVDLGEMCHHVFERDRFSTKILGPKRDVLVDPFSFNPLTHRLASFLDPLSKFLLS